MSAERTGSQVPNRCHPLFILVILIILIILIILVVINIIVTLLIL